MFYPAAASTVSSGAVSCSAQRLRMSASRRPSLTASPAAGARELDRRARRRPSPLGMPLVAALVGARRPEVLPRRAEALAVPGVTPRDDQEATRVVDGRDARSIGAIVTAGEVLDMGRAVRRSAGGTNERWQRVN